MRDNGKRVAYLVALLTMTLVAGCVHLNLESKDKDAAAKEFRTYPDQSVLYIERHGGTSPQMNFRVKLDGQMLGPYAEKGFFMVRVRPGPHDILVINPANMNDGLRARISVTTEPGKLYFINHYSTMMGKQELSVLSEKKGKKNIRRAKLVKRQAVQGPQMFEGP